LESEIILEILCNFTNQTLEWQFSDQQISGFLVTTNFTQSDGSWSGSVWLLDSSGCWG
jgi:hypothetical protein